MAGQEWQRFRVGTPSRGRGFNPDCCPLVTVAHVAHVDTAASIIRDRAIRAGLVFDKSKLRTRRVLVSWFSPNHWHHGYRYGNVGFEIDWRKLIKNRDAYWVESIAYGVEACRILLTSVDRSSRLTRYDPAVGDGPWWYDEEADEHYWNGECCLEIMVEGEIPLKDVSAIHFQKHHARQCNIDAATCADRDVGARQGGARFLAILCGNELKLDDRLTTSEDETSPEDAAPEPHADVEAAALRLLRDLKPANGKFSGDLRHGSATAKAVARAAFAAYGRRNLSESSQLVALFEEDTEFNRVATRLLRDVLGWKPRGPDDW